MARRDSRAQRVFAVGLLVVLAAAWWWVGGQSVRAPRLLGSLGGRAVEVEEMAGPAIQVRGIGRFARAR